MEKFKPPFRRLLAFDGNRWYIRQIACIMLDGINNEKVYYCDKPLGNKKGYKNFEDIPKRYK